MASIPTPIRATLGLLATALDAVQELVDHAPEIPMEAVGNSMQLSLRLQQHYVALLTRGDEFLASLRGAPEEPPAWATFDESPPSGPNADPPTGADPFTEDGLTGGGLTEGGLTEDGLTTGADPWADAVDDLPEAEIQDGPRHAGQGDPLLAAATRGRPVAAPTPRPAKKATPAAAPAKKARARKAPAEKAPAKKAPAVKGAAKKAPAQKAPAKKAPAAKAAGAKTTAAKKVPPVKATSTRPATDPAAPAAPVLDSAGPIPSPGAPAKRGRPAKKAGALKATVAPQLDASLTVGAPSARPQSAFDLTDPSTSASTTDVGLSALPGAGATDDGVGPSAPQIH